MRKLPIVALITILLNLGGCAVTSHPAEHASLGVTRGMRELERLIDQPGPIVLTTVNSADWQVSRAGLIDLDDPRAKAAGLHDGDEPIQIYFHALRHPDKGLFLVDTGVERALRDDPEHAAIRGLVTRFMDFQAMKFHQPLGDWLAQQREPVRGVFMTHLHLDHVAGMADVPRDTPVYTGPGEAASSALLHAFVKRSTNRALAGKPALQEWRFSRSKDQPFAGVLDVFGDGSVWALWTPGHTPGSTSYLVRTAQGPVLMVGDTCHTRWGWEHHVAPGSFTSDRPANARSLDALEALVAAHPTIEVRLGHQH
ncbi:MAG: metallo-beta-lactamase family protein [Myxococcaceae bacterium]|nr:metallo-beta-lactamase family protein [Myxococcaceae bacterium]